MNIQNVQKTNFSKCDEWNISKLRLRQHLVTKSLNAIILEAKQELSTGQKFKNEHVVMNVNLAKNHLLVILKNL